MENPPALVVRKGTLGGTVNCELILLHILYSGYTQFFQFCFYIFFIDLYFLYSAVPKVMTATLQFWAEPVTKSVRRSLLIYLGV